MELVWSRKELLLYGFIKEYAPSEIPEDVIKTCFQWYHTFDLFKQAGFSITISDDGKTISSNAYQTSSAYGDTVIPSISDKNEEYEVELQVLRIKDTEGFICVSIGIDDARCLNLAKDFCGCKETENYGYYSVNGTVYGRRMDAYGDEYGNSYTEGDVIRMVYNACESTLTFYKNGENQGVIENIVSNENLNYRICVCLGIDTSASVKLL